MGHVFYNNFPDERVPDERKLSSKVVFKDLKMNGGVSEIVIRTKLPLVLCFVCPYGDAFRHDTHACTFIRFSTHIKRCMVHKVCFMLIFP